MTNQPSIDSQIRKILVNFGVAVAEDNLEKHNQTKFYDLTLTDRPHQALQALVAQAQKEARVDEAVYILDNCAYKYGNNNRMISPMLIKDRIKELNDNE